MQFTPFTLPILGSGVAAAWAATFVLRRRAHTPAAKEFVVTAGASALMCFAYAAELSSATLPYKLAWLNVRWIGICVMPLAGFLMALRWMGHERWLRPVPVALMSVVPVATLLLAWANPWLEVLAGPSVLLPRDGYVLRTAPTHAGFWVFVAHAYACTLAMAWVYAKAIWSSPIHRQQGILLLTSTPLPALTNAIYVFGFSPEPGFDLSHVGYGLTALIWGWVLARRQLFDLAPVARGRVFESLADAVLVLDADQRVIDHNPAATRFLGSDALLGAPLSRLVGEEMARTLERAGVVHLLGRELAVDSATVRGSGISATVLTLRDVSAQRQAELAREEALRMAADAARVRSQFLARMSHEVRGPLHGVVGAADLLLSAQLPSDARRYAEAVSSSSRVLLALVDELLDFSRLDADRLRVDVEDLDARESLDEVASLFAGAAEKRGVAIVVEAPKQIGVLADPVRLRQVLVNLVGNAVKFTDRGSITLRARHEGALHRFEVVDTGVGIAEEAQARIFEPFMQLGVPARSGPSGTGLGLSIARRLCELMGGELGVNSRPGAGSTFWFTLPARDAIGPSSPVPAPPRSPAAPRTGRVLVVDDNPVNRLVTCGLVEREGCEVEPAADAAAALRALEASDVALVLTDVRMPGMTGHALTQAIRALPGPAAELPVVVLTGDIHEGAREEALAAGANGWLAKPVDPAELRAMLDRHLPAERSAESPPDLRTWLSSAPEALHRIQDAFCTSVPLEVDQLREAASAGAWQRLRDQAHALRGASAVVGAVELESLCTRLMAASGEEAREVLPALERAAADAVARMSQDTRARGSVA